MSLRSASADCRNLALGFLVAAVVFLQPDVPVNAFGIRITKPKTPRWARPATDALAELDPTNPGSWTRERLAGLDPSRGAHKEMRISGKHFGKGFGEGIKPTMDAAIDRASMRLEQNIRFASSEADNLLKNHEEEFNKIATDRLNQLKGIVDASLKDVDKIADKSLKSLDKIANNTLDRSGAIIDKSLDRTESILHGGLDRTEEIVDNALSRADEMSEQRLAQFDKTLSGNIAKVRDLQEDTFARMSGTVQDEIPFATSIVFRQMEVLGLVLLVGLVLIGAVGWTFVKGIQAELATKKKQGAREPTDISMWKNVRRYFTEDLVIAWRGCKANLGMLPRLLLRVGTPIILVAIALHLFYVAYLVNAQNVRVNSLVGFAESFERTGDFRFATTYRRRVFTLDNTLDSRYFVLRNDWIGSYLTNYKEVPADKLMSELQFMTDTPGYAAHAAKDIELTCLRLYVASMHELPTGALLYLLPEADDSGFTVEVDKPAPAEATDDSDAFRKDIDAYRVAVIDAILGEVQESFRRSDETGNKVPFCGRYVYIARLSDSLGDVSTSLKDRLIEADRIAHEMVCVYPAYAPGLLLSAQITAVKHDSWMKGPDTLTNGEEYLRGAADEDTAVKDAIAAELRESQAKFAAVTQYEPMLAKRYLQMLAEAPEDLVKKIVEIADDNALDDPDRLVSLKEEMKNWADQVKERCMEYTPSEFFARLEAERRLITSIARGVRQDRLSLLIKKARESLQQGNAKSKYENCVQVFEESIALDRMDIAELWFLRSEKVIEDDPDTEGFGTPEFKEDRDQRRKDLTVSAVGTLVFLP